MRTVLSCALPCPARKHTPHVCRNQVRPFRRHRWHGHGLRRRRDERQRLRRHRVRPGRLCAHVHFSGRKRDRGDERLRRIEPEPQAGPDSYWQRYLARQSRSRSGARTQVAVLFAARVAQGMVHPGQTLPGRDRHARQDDHDLPVGLGLCPQRAEPKLPHRRHPEQFRTGRPLYRQRMVHHRGRRI